MTAPRHAFVPSTSPGRCLSCLEPLDAIVHAPVPVLRTASDVTPAHLAWAEQVHDDWFDDGEPIDWEDFVDRMDDPRGYSPCGPFEFDEYWNPAVKKIQRHVRAYRRAG